MESVPLAYCAFTIDFRRFEITISTVIFGLDAVLGSSVLLGLYFCVCVGGREGVLASGGREGNDFSRNHGAVCSAWAATKSGNFDWRNLVDFWVLVVASRLLVSPLLEYRVHLSASMREVHVV